MPIVLSCGWDHKSFDGGKEVEEPRNALTVHRAFCNAGEVINAVT
ncbi:MAG: hypothetical protein ACOX44_00195 [Limnochordia bacterium]